MKLVDTVLCNFTEAEEFTEKDLPSEIKNALKTLTTPFKVVQVETSNSVFWGVELQNKEASLAGFQVKDMVAVKSFASLDVHKGLLTIFFKK